MEREVKELTVTLQTLQSEKQQLTEDDQEMIRQRAKLEFDVKDLEESMVDDRKSKVCSCTVQRENLAIKAFAQKTCLAEINLAPYYESLARFWQYQNKTAKLPKLI